MMMMYDDVISICFSYDDNFCSSRDQENLNELSSIILCDLVT